MAHGEATCHALLVEWPIAVESYAKAIAGEYANNPEVWFEYATVRILAGDAPGYREVCSSLLERCEKDNLRRFLVARACTLVKGTDQALARAAELGMPELDLHAEPFLGANSAGRIAMSTNKTSGGKQRSGAESPI